MLYNNLGLFHPIGLFLGEKVVFFTTIAGKPLKSFQIVVQCAAFFKVPLLVVDSF
jgi:hypothetical protein